MCWALVANGVENGPGTETGDILHCQIQSVVEPKQTTAGSQKKPSWIAGGVLPGTTVRSTLDHQLVAAVKLWSDPAVGSRRSRREHAHGPRCGSTSETSFLRDVRYPRRWLGRLPEKRVIKQQYNSIARRGLGSSCHNSMYIWPSLLLLPPSTSPTTPPHTLALNCIDYLVRIANSSSVMDDRIAAGGLGCRLWYQRSDSCQIGSLDGARWCAKLATDSGSRAMEPGDPLSSHPASPPPITFFRQQRTNIGLIFKAGHNSVMKGEGGGRWTLMMFHRALKRALKLDCFMINNSSSL